MAGAWSRYGNRRERSMASSVTRSSAPSSRPASTQVHHVSSRSSRRCRPEIQSMDTAAPRQDGRGASAGGPKRLPCAEGRHDLFGEQAHRLENLFLAEVAEREAAVEVVDAHDVLEPPNLPDALVWRPDDREVVQDGVDGRLVRKRHVNGVAVLNLRVVVAQAEGDPHVPASLLGGGAGVSLVVGDVDEALGTDLDRLLWLIGDQMLVEGALE